MFLASRQGQQKDEYLLPVFTVKCGSLVSIPFRPLVLNNTYYGTQAFTTPEVLEIQTNDVEKKVVKVFH